VNQCSAWACPRRCRRAVSLGRHPQGVALQKVTRNTADTMNNPGYSQSTLDSGGWVDLSYCLRGPYDKERSTAPGLNTKREAHPVADLGQMVPQWVRLEISFFCASAFLSMRDMPATPGGCQIRQAAHAPSLENTGRARCEGGRERSRGGWDCPAPWRGDEGTGMHGLGNTESS
jgi:hypothetical protein